jgi:FAD/FMN-containing dehydrogenase
VNASADAPSRQLACDNVVRFQLVTAAGELLHASDSEHPDLYWGLRGGGGNFGVVTQFEFRLHPVGQAALLVDLFYPPEEPAAMARPAARRAAAGDPHRLGRHERALVVPAACVAQPPADQRRLRLGRRAGSGTQAAAGAARRGTTAGAAGAGAFLPGAAAHRRPPAAAWAARYWKGHFLRELADQAIEAFVSRGAGQGDGRVDGDPAGLPSGSLQGYGGAIAAVGDDQTAFAHRDALVEFVAAASWTDAAEDQARMAAARRYGAAVAPFASGVYVNALTDEGAAGVRRAYRSDKLARLVALKDRYDPDNVFHLNHNIRPSQARAR